MGRAQGLKPPILVDLERTPASTVKHVTYAIAEAAHRSGLSIDTLRYYERIELIDPPARDSGGRRVYTDDDLAWLAFLTRLRTTGMPIKLMREYARLRDQGPVSAGARKRILERHREDVKVRIAELTSCLDALDYKIENYEQIIRAETLSTIQEASA